MPFTSHESDLNHQIGSDAPITMFKASLTAATPDAGDPVMTEIGVFVAEASCSSWWCCFHEAPDVSVGGGVQQLECDDHALMSLLNPPDTDQH